MNHALQCTCGTLKGLVSHPERVKRVGAPVAVPRILSGSEREAVYRAV